MQTPSALRLMVFAAMAAMTSYAQQVGDNTAETHPPLKTQTCTKAGCKADDTSIVLDANWRWTYKTGTSTNCYKGNEWDKTICSDPKTCASSCALDGADYTGTYGITAEDDSLSLKLVTKGQYSTNVGSRVYVMESDDTYKVYKLLNQEFTFDVDVSTLDCGLNSALYFVDMEPDGGMKSFPSNKAGAKYGTGYCDAQCPHDLKFISGEANILNWTPNKVDENAGSGKYGSCCAEMDIWEANSISNAYTTHPCTVKPGGAHRCSTPKECGDAKARYDGVCDKDGCDFNPYRMGNKTFFGPGSEFTIDTTKPFTVVTRFITDDNTAEGTLTDIKRFYVQGGATHEMAKSTYVKGMNSITDAQCSAAKKVFGDEDDHKAKGGLKQMGLAMKSGMVLTISLWTDNLANLLWLDSDYPTTASASKPGVSRGSCPKTSGVPKDVIAKQPDSTIKFTNIRIGDIGTTVKGIKATTTKKTAAAPAAETANEADDVANEAD
ncbi:Glycosyl hydrolase, partial [Phytophthora megakarya]